MWIPKPYKKQYTFEAALIHFSKIEIFKSSITKVTYKWKRTITVNTQQQISKSMLTFLYIRTFKWTNLRMSLLLWICVSYKMSLFLYYLNCQMKNWQENHYTFFYKKSHFVKFVKTLIVGQIRYKSIFANIWRFFPILSKRDRMQQSNCN